MSFSLGDAAGNQRTIEGTYPAVITTGGKGSGEFFEAAVGNFLSGELEAPRPGVGAGVGVEITPIVIGCIGRIYVVTIGEKSDSGIAAYSSQRGL